MPSSITDSPPNPMPDPSSDVLALLSQARAFYPSHELMISAGTVTVDLEVKKVLIVFNRRQGIYQLPKGRKNIGEESFLECALRETREETGLCVTPLRLKVATRATPAAPELLLTASHDLAVSNGNGNGANGATGGRGGLVDWIANHEMTGCCQYRDLTTGAMKMVFYYVATGDCGLTPEPLVGEDEGRFENVWFDAGEAAAKLLFKEDGMIVDKALQDIRRSGYDI